MKNRAQRLVENIVDFAKDYASELTGTNPESKTALLSQIQAIRAHLDPKEEQELQDFVFFAASRRYGTGNWNTEEILAHMHPHELQEVVQRFRDSVLNRPRL